MKEQTCIKETFATLEDFVNEARTLVKDKNNFSYINRDKYEMCMAKMNINGVYGEAFGIMEDGRILLTHVVKYSVDRGTKKCYSFYRDQNGITNPEIARKVERQRRKYPEGASLELSLINSTIEKGRLRNNTKKNKTASKSQYKLRKGVNVPYRLNDAFFRKIRNGYYTKNFLIYDKLGERILDIKENVEDFLVKNKKNIIIVFATSAIGLSIFVGGTYPEPTRFSEKVNQSSNLAKEKEAYLAYLTNVNNDYLYNDENISYYLGELSKTLDNYKKALFSKNDNLIHEIDDFYNKQLDGLKILISNRFKERNEDVELDEDNLKYVDGEFVNPEKSFSK